MGDAEWMERSRATFTSNLSSHGAASPIPQPPPPGCSPINIQVGRSSAIIVAGQTAQGLGAGGVGSGNGVCGEGRVGSGHISKVMLQELVCNCRRVSLRVAPPTIPQIYGHQLFFLQKSPSNTSADLTDCRTLRVDSREHGMRDGLHRLRCLLLVHSLVELSSLCCIPPFRPLKSSTAPKKPLGFHFCKKVPPFFLPNTLQKRFFNLLFFSKVAFFLMGALSLFFSAVADWKRVRKRKRAGVQTN